LKTTSFIRDRMEARPHTPLGSQVTDSSDSSDEGELSLDDRPEYREEQEVAQVLSLEERADDNSLEEQLGRVKLAEGALSEGVGASFGEKGALPPHIDIGSLGSNSTIVIGTHITVLPAEKPCCRQKIRNQSRQARPPHQVKAPQLLTTVRQPR